MEQLDVLRRELDAIDDEIVDAIARRLRKIAEIGAVKRTGGIPMMQPHRIQHVMERCRQRAENAGLAPEFLTGIYKQIIDEACRIEDEIIDKEATEIPSTR